MLSKNEIQEALKYTLQEATLSNLGTPYRGKVRDCYIIGDKRILVSSDRLSAFDVVLTTIPFKGQLLNALTNYWFKKTAHIAPNHIIANPHPNVFIGKEAKIIPIEVVIRNYLAGSAWRDYQSGNKISGVTLPAGMKRFEKLSAPILTPSTKAESGKHDEPISESEILSRGLVSEEIWSQVTQYALALFNFASSEVAKKGLLMVDTKYEFGLVNDSSGKQIVILADEIHTQDCSRFFEASSYESRISAGLEPEMFDKEFIRSWLMNQGYMGEGTPPNFPDDFKISITEKYINAFERISGETFVPNYSQIDEDEILKIVASGS